MSITIPFTGQFGNQLFGFVVGKILAERTGQTYQPQFPCWTQKNGDPVEYSTRIPFIAQPVPTMGREVAGHLQLIDSLHWIDLDAIDPNRPMLIRSYFQRYELIAPYKQQIREDWLKIAPLWTTDPNTVYVHVRRTDYVGDDLNPDRQCIAHTIPEYLRCLEEFPAAKTVRIVSDDLADPFIRQLSDAIMATGLDTIFFSAPWDADFMELASAKWLIISQSTFAWWAGWLGRAEKIVCPVSPSSLWGRGRGLKGKPIGTDYPNLEVTNEGDRWKWVTT